MTLPATTTSVFGYHTMSLPQKDNPVFELYTTKLNLVSYIPILGLLGSLLRITLAIKATPEVPLAFKAILIVRAIFEGLGGGLLFLIPDLIAYTARHICHSSPKPLASSQQPS